MCAYQSPIILNMSNSMNIEHYIFTLGKNYGAVYNSVKKIFEVHDNIILIVNNKMYKLFEYHFHMSSEHVVNNMIYPAELHYVFVELSDDEKGEIEYNLNNKEHNFNNIDIFEDINIECGYYNICDGIIPKDRDTLIIGRVATSSTKVDIS